MKINSSKKLTGAFIGLQFILYFIFIVLDVTGDYYFSSIIKFASIVMCLIMSIVILIFYEHFLDRVILSIALLLTVFADIFLLFTDNHLMGVILFLIVQTVYLVRIASVSSLMERIDGRVYGSFRKRKGMSYFLGQILLRISISLIIFVIFYLVQIPLDVLLLISVVYIISFLMNICLVLRMKERTHYFQGSIRLGLFLLGMVLFLMCDIMVGVFNISGYVVLSTKIYQIFYQVASIGMWIFYLPGQILITLS